MIKFFMKINIGGISMKKIVALLVVLMLAIPMVVNAAFSDVAEEHWAKGFIDKLTSSGVINGYPDGTFRPSDTLTKGAFLKLIVTASLPEVDFNQLDKNFDHWAATYVKVAENYNVLEKGAITKENIDEPITRIDVIKILSLCDINMRSHEQKALDYLTFTDTDGLDETSEILLSHAVANGIIGGYPDGSFKPQNNLTRAEASKILAVYMEK